MDSREGNRAERRRQLQREIERYQEAAVSALDQLEWIVGYLHKLGKSEIARAIDRNRKEISEAIR
jgi:hypothetical protein